MAAADKPKTITGWYTRIMASVYYRDRVEAGQKAAKKLLATNGNPASVVSLSTDSVLVAAQLAVRLKCPLQLYLSSEITVPGDITIGGIDQDGNFNFGGGSGGASYGDYYYQEFGSYIEQEKRETFSALNRELGSMEVLRKDLLNKRNVFLVADCLEAMTGIESFLNSVKSITMKKIIICAPITLSESLTPIQRMCEEYFVDGVVDFFYGADHYFEDNTVVPRKEAIDKISEALAAWPRR